MKRKTLITILCITAGIAILFFSGRYFILTKVRSALIEKMDELKKKGISITYNSLELNPWSGHLLTTGIRIRIGEDSTQLAADGSATRLEIAGVEILPLLLQKSLSIQSISIVDPHLVYTSKFKWPMDSESNSKTKAGIPLKHLSIGYIHFDNASFLMKDSIKSDTSISATASMVVRHLNMDQLNDSLQLRQADLTLTPVNVIVPGSYYRYQIKQVHFNMQDKLFVLDSLKVIPLYDRDTFMQKAGEQTSRMEALLSQLSLKGLVVSRDPTLRVEVKESEVNFTLHVYRDKRYPFLKKTQAEMPMEFLQKLPFQLNIDTIKIKDSYVRYAEFPEKGDSIGYVFFEKLNSTISHLHNRAIANEDVTMHTTALFMGKGKLDAHFTFPSDTTQPYKTTGSLKDFPMTQVNQILEPSFQTRIESGIMSSFGFNFIYNKVRSDGNVELNYDQLKIVSLQKDKNDKTIVNKLKTAVINLFVLKRNAAETTRGDKKQGTILYYRDSRRALFHFWWKSLFSGLVTAYKLDGLVPDLKDHGKEVSSEVKDKSKNKNKK
ncbi:MAG: hypothetical protein DI538_19790 [Azospira oryzae]|nr:MAG: hypothetical protein DI538_19790 [Azospira oryzae]